MSHNRPAVSHRSPVWGPNLLRLTIAIAWTCAALGMGWVSDARGQLIWKDATQLSNPPGVNSASGEGGPVISPAGDLWFHFGVNANETVLMKSTPDGSGGWNKRTKELTLDRGVHNRDPFFSPDGTTFYFASTDRNFTGGNFGGYDIFAAPVTDGVLGAPVNLGPVTNGAGDESGPHYDGKKLTFDRGGDIYESTGSGTSWTAPSNTPFVNVNTGGFEDSPSISQDGQVMYFGRDNKMFRSELSDGVWGTGVNLQPSITGRFLSNDQGDPFFLGEGLGQTLYFHQFKNPNSWEISSATATAERAPVGTQPFHWRLIWTGDPAREAILSWDTREAGERHVALVRSADGGQQRTVDAHSGPYQTSGGTLHFHHARLRDLAPDTQYHATMESDGDKSQEFWFRTAPSEDRKLGLIFGGDSRSDQSARQQVNHMIAELVEKNPSILAFAHGGDYIASGHSLEQWSRWLDDHQLTVTAKGRLLPIIPARGNHDKGPLFDEVFAFPDGDANYYAVSLGPRVRLVTLNTNASAAGDQRDWLAAELAASRPRYRWLLAQYHRPAFPAVKSPGGSKQHWVPLFEEHNVDLVCEADGHVVKRTVPIRNDQHDPSGVVYIGEGGLGVPQRQPKKGRWYLDPPGMAAYGHHVQVIRLSADELVCEVIALDGKTMDTYRRPPRK